MNKPPTLEDVAARAGVSTATVSRCLNAPDRVAERTRDRVMAAVKALGYAPNFSAQALAARRTRTIGAILPTIENAIFAEGLQAFQDVLQAAGYTLLIASSGYDPVQEAEGVRTLVQRGADGLLLIGQDRAPEIYPFLETQEVPVVIGWAHDPGGGPVSVGFDNRAAMRALVGAALDMGHRRIGVISAYSAENDRARARVAGVQDALSDIGAVEAPVIETDYGVSQGQVAARRMLAEHPEITLLVCGNDVLAAGAIAGAEEMGLSVPGDVSVTGFDDIALAGLVRPRLTTVRVPHRRMGEEAARTLLALVGGEPVRSVLLPTEVTMRESLGPARPALVP